MLGIRTEYGTVVAALAISLQAGVAFAGAFTPVSQSREIRAEDHHVTTGYTCLGGGGGPPLPACPVVLGDVTTSDVQTAPGFVPDPFVATASVPLATAQHISSVQPLAIGASGSGSATGSAAEQSQSGYVLVLSMHHRSVLDTTEVIVDLDEPTPFTFEASGHVDYPDPNVPAAWSVDLAISLEGPGGVVAELDVVPGFACPELDPDTQLCRLEPAPLQLSGVLPAGQYALRVSMSSSADGNWWPSVGAFGGTTAAEYDVALALGSPGPVPLLGPVGIAILAVLFVAAAVALNSRAGRSE